MYAVSGRAPIPEICLLHMAASLLFLSFFETATDRNTKCHLLRHHS
jgi:hypothetical protein